MRRTHRLFAASFALFLTHCVPQEPAEPIPPLTPKPTASVTAPPPPLLPREAPPLGRLPDDVRPVLGSILLEVNPNHERFHGTITFLLDLTKPRDVIWLHGKNLAVQQASIRMEGEGPVAATYTQVDESGVAALRLKTPLGPGRATLRLDYDAPFATTAEGMYTTSRDGKKYVFTQLEAVAARLVFPCFDEPSVKIPYDVSLFVPKGMSAIANTREIERKEVTDDSVRISFAQTPPLPAYLLALAVGPLDIVQAPSIPPNSVRKRPIELRGVSVSGRGREMAYALGGTPQVLEALETYLGIEYPFDKLDIIAVPDKRGAMENPGAVTFAESLVLMDENTAPTQAKRGYWSVMFHELAHQWFGDLVTMEWWDDVWLNEAFATWATARLLPLSRPGDGVPLHRMQGVHDAMGLDSLVSARKVRQDVGGVHDIANTFDAITYRKGGSVITMFERFLGEETFRSGITSYLNAHRGGTATADDLFAALSVAASKDVGGPFRTFVNQSGVPLVEAHLTCNAQGNFLSLKQSRHLPLGSAGDPKRSWQIPVCAKVPSTLVGKKADAALQKNAQEVCTLLTGEEGSLPLPSEKCPAWVMPNSNASGYYVFSMPTSDMKNLLTKGFPTLHGPERLAVTQALRMALSRGTPVADLLPVLLPLAKEPERQVAAAAMYPYRLARTYFSRAEELSAIEKHAQKTFGPVWKGLGFGPKKGKTEDDERRALRADVLSFMVFVAKDPTVRKEAKERGLAYVGYGKDGALHPDAADKDLLGTCLAVAAEQGDAAFFDHLVALLDKALDEATRFRLVSALAAFAEPTLAAKALGLTLSSHIRSPELTTILEAHLASPLLRDNAWRYFLGHIDNIAAKRPAERRGNLPLLAMAFCDRSHAEDLSKAFASRIQNLEGGPRNLSTALEAIHLCSAQKAAQEASFRKALNLPPPLLAVLNNDNGVADPWAKRVSEKAPAVGPTNTKLPPQPKVTFSANPDGVLDPWAKRSPKAGTSSAPPAAAAPTPNVRPPGSGPNGVLDPWAKKKK